MQRHFFSWVQCHFHNVENGKLFIDLGTYDQESITNTACRNTSRIWNSYDSHLSSATCAHPPEYYNCTTLFGCNQPIIFFSHTKSAPATSHSQPNSTPSALNYRSFGFFDTKITCLIQKIVQNITSFVIACFINISSSKMT